MIAAYGRRSAALDSRQQQALEGLAKLAGYDAHIRKDNLYGWTLVGTGKPLPSDIAPLVVMDASAPLMTRYDDWSAYGFNIVRMTPAQVTYDGVTIHWWDRASGKTALNSAANRREVFAAVSKLINGKPDEQWLVIHYRSLRRQGEKDGELPRDFHDLLEKPDNVRPLHWGLHTASNAYRDIRNVIVIGALDYGVGAYEGIARASTGKAEGPSTAMLLATRHSEFAHNLYQAICRSNVRNSEDGRSGQANIYLVMSASSEREAKLEQAFPGSIIGAWEPVSAKPLTKLELVQSTLTNLLAASTSATIKEVREACGAGHNASYLTKVVKDERFIKFLAAKRIKRVKQRFVRLN